MAGPRPIRGTRTTRMCPSCSGTMLRSDKHAGAWDCRGCGYGLAPKTNLSLTRYRRAST